ncbi:MAG: hypothetical protein ACMUHB_05190, partial [Thermoplasmatota archaeon]
MAPYIETVFSSPHDVSGDDLPFSGVSGSDGGFVVEENVIREAVRPESDQPSRGDQVNEKSFSILPDDTSRISSMENILIDGGHFKFLDKRLNLNVETGAHPRTSFKHPSGRNIQTYDGHVYAGFITTGMSMEPWVCYWIMVSEDDGASWNDPILIKNRTNCLSGSVEIYLYQDKIFYLTIEDRESGFSDGLYVRVASYLNWRSLATGFEITLSSESLISQTRMVGADDSVICFWKGDHFSSPKYRIYTGGSWATASTVPQECYIMSVSVLQTASKTTIAVLGDMNNGRINLVRSKDTCDTWDSSVSVTNSVTDVQSLSTVGHGDEIHIAVTGSSSGVFYGWLNSTKVSIMKRVMDFFPNGMDNIDGEITVAADEKGIWVAFENGRGNITVAGARSKDDDFTLVQKMGAGTLHSPVMDDSRSYYLHMNGASMQIFKLSPCLQAKMVTSPLSPPGLLSWNSLGLSFNGFDGFGGVYLRILSADLEEQYFPGQGFFDITDASPGSVAGSNVDHFTDLSGMWTSGASLADPIVVEMEWMRKVEDDPTVDDLRIGFTVGMPVIDDPISQYHIVNVQGCDILEDGISIKAAETYGYFTVGPFYGGDLCPDHFSIICSSLDDNNIVKAEIVDRNMDPVPGFGLEDSLIMKRNLQRIYLRWGERYPYDLPGSMGVFHLRIMIQSNGIFAPTVNALIADMSAPPEILSARLSHEGILRGSEAVLYFDLADREEASSDLELEVECTGPDGQPCCPEHISKPYWEGGKWCVNFLADISCPTGEYSFRAVASDSTDRESQVISEGLSLLVDNNPPLPPLVMAYPAHPKTGEVIGVSKITPGSDIETPEEELTYRVRYFKEDDLEFEFPDLDEPECELDPGMVMKGETWTIEITTWDGQNESSPLSFDVVIENSAPFVKALPKKIEMEEDGFAAFPVGDWFGDIDSDTLSYSISTTSGLNARVHHGYVEISPWENLHGRMSMTMNVSDGMDSLTTTIAVVVEPVNDPPAVFAPKEVVSRQDQWTFVEVYATDFADGYGLNVTTNILDRIPELVAGESLFTYPNGSFRFLPGNDMVGDHNITITVSDSGLIIHRYLDLEIRNINDPPMEPEITIIEIKGVYDPGEIVQLEGEADDLDLVHGDSLTYVWSSDRQGFLGEGSSISTSLLPGIHRITLTVEDEYGGYNSSWVVIKVLADEMSVQESLPTNMLLILVGAISFIISLLVAVLILLLIFRGRSKKVREPEESGEVEEPEPQGSKADESPKAPPLLQGKQPAGPMALPAARTDKPSTP